MVANTGPEEDCDPEVDSVEGPSAVATMTRLIHDLYAADGSHAAIRGGRDCDLIVWSEMLGAVRRRASPPDLKFPLDN